MSTIFPILDWHLNHGYMSLAEQHLGRIPLLINPQCNDPVWLQVQDNYPDGWNPVPAAERHKWTLTGDEYLIYLGLPPVAPAAMAWLRSEKILVYPAGWVVVVQLNGDFTVARILP